MVVTAEDMLPLIDVASGAMTLSHLLRGGVAVMENNSFMGLMTLGKSSSYRFSSRTGVHRVYPDNQCQRYTSQPPLSQLETPYLHSALIDIRNSG